MINIQVNDVSPEVSIDRRLKSRLQTFEFDQERFTTGLELLDVPPTAIDSLDVRFSSGRLLGRNTQRYIEGKHRLDIGIPGKQIFEENREFLNVDTYHWSSYIDDPSAHLNYRLAYTSYGMAGTILKSQEMLRYRRLLNNDATLIKSVVFGSGGVGLATGVGLSEMTGYNPLLSGFCFAGVGLTFGAAGLVADWQTPTKKEGSREMKALYEEHEKRAADFARSREAQDTFGKVVKIELIK